MSLHIGAAPGVIAGAVIITGDPLRARFVAEKMMTDVVCYSEIRGMLGFTGYYHSHRISVQGTGIGIPSTALYLHELIYDYGARRIIRLGTCGALHPGLQILQPIMATAAFTDSATHLHYHSDHHTPALPDRELMILARERAAQLNIPLLEGPVFSTDTFYSDDPMRWVEWQSRGILAVEMESSILYGLTAKANVSALTLLTVSDNILTHASSPAADRQEVDEEMLTLVFDVAASKM